MFIRDFCAKIKIVSIKYCITLKLYVQYLQSDGKQEKAFMIKLLTLTFCVYFHCEQSHSPSHVVIC